MLWGEKAQYDNEQKKKGGEEFYYVTETFPIFHFSRITMAILTSIECRDMKYVFFFLPFRCPTIYLLGIASIAASNNNNDEYLPIFHLLRQTKIIVSGRSIVNLYKGKDTKEALQTFFEKKG